MTDVTEPNTSAEKNQIAEWPRIRRVYTTGVIVFALLVTKKPRAIASILKQNT